MYVYIYITYLFTYIHACCIHPRIRPSNIVQPSFHAAIRASMYPCIRPSTHPCIHPSIHAFIHACMYAYIDTYVCVCVLFSH